MLPSQRKLTVLVVLGSALLYLIFVMYKSETNPTIQASRASNNSLIIIRATDGLNTSTSEIRKLQGTNTSISEIQGTQGLNSSLLHPEIADLCGADRGRVLCKRITSPRHYPCPTVTGKPPCDTQCTALGKLLTAPSWTLERAVIYILTQPGRHDSLVMLLTQLDENFPYPYPLLVFHEQNYNATDLESLRKLVTTRQLFYQMVDLNTPRWVNAARAKYCPFPTGYKNMCRFHAKCVYREPALQHARYMWRLDDDAQIPGPVTIDVFTELREGGDLYGYMKDTADEPGCTVGLWDTARDFVSTHALRTTFFQLYPSPQMFYNNFEVSHVGLWRSHLYQAYMNHIDAANGIYENRWGDAPIKSIFVSIAVELSELRWFGEIPYRHNYNINRGVASREAQSHRLNLWPY